VLCVCRETQQLATNDVLDGSVHSFLGTSCASQPTQPTLASAVYPGLVLDSLLLMVLSLPVLLLPLLMLWNWPELQRAS
jgi:hypothetical protein